MKYYVYSTQYQYQYRSDIGQNVRPLDPDTLKRHVVDKDITSTTEPETKVSD